MGVESNNELITSSYDINRFVRNDMTTFVLNPTYFSQVHQTPHDLNTLPKQINSYTYSHIKVSYYTDLVTLKIVPNIRVFWNRWQWFLHLLLRSSLCQKSKCVPRKIDLHTLKHSHYLFTFIFHEDKILLEK